MYDLLPVKSGFHLNATLCPPVIQAKAAAAAQSAQDDKPSTCFNLKLYADDVVLYLKETSASAHACPT